MQSRTMWCRSPEGREGAYEVTLTYELRNTKCSSYVLNRLEEITNGSTDLRVRSSIGR